MRKNLWSALLIAVAISGAACMQVTGPSGLGDDIVSGPSGPSGEDRDNAFRSLAVHPLDPDTVIVGTERNGIVLSTDGGESWSRKRQGLWHWYGSYPEVWDIAFDPDDPDTIYAATLDSPGPPVGEYPSACAGLYRSTDGGETWTRTTDALPTSRITSVQVVDGVVVTGAEGGWVSFSELAGRYFEGGLYRSTSQGATWERATVGPTDGRNGFWRIAVCENGDLITFGLSYGDLSENVGFLRSSDGGRTWEPFADELRSLMIHAFAVSSDGRAIFANVRDTYVMRISLDGGETWRTSSINQANGPVVVSPIDANLVLYAAGGRIYRSTDGLATFAEIFRTSNITDIVFAPSDPSVVYAVADGYLIFKSTDSGGSFAQIVNLRTDVLNR